MVQALPGIVPGSDGINTEVARQIRFSMVKEKLHIQLQPGKYYVSADDIVLSTLLGSCVSACMYDPVSRIVGMNHFLLSNRRYSRDLPYYATEAGRYGIHAMELVINDMLRLGAKKEHLRAKAFGGASLFQQLPDVGNFFCVGSVNERFIRAFLQQEEIPLVSQDMGGECGRVIRFHSDDYSVYVRKIQPAVNEKLGRRERQYWQTSIEQHEKAPSSSELWE
jgi:chemotaxis protein CheD